MPVNQLSQAQPESVGCGGSGGGRYWKIGAGSADHDRMAWQAGMGVATYTEDADCNGVFTALGAPA